MASTELRLSSLKNSEGKSQVIVKLTVTRTHRPCFKSGVWVKPEWFKPTKKTKKGNNYGIVPPKSGKLNIIEVQEATDAKLLLTGYINRLEKICAALDEPTKNEIEEALVLTDGVPYAKITKEAIEEARSLQQRTGGKSVLDFYGMMEYYLQKKQFSYDQEKGFRVLMRALARYEAFVRETDNEKKDFTLDINTIDKETIEDFTDYLRNEQELSVEYPELFKRLLTQYPSEISPKHKTKKIEQKGNNTITKLQKKLKAFFIWCIEKEYTSNQPFRGITIKSEVYGTPYYLTLEERNMIADKVIENKATAVQRDIFIFQCLVGCRVGDLLRLIPSNIVDGVLEYIPNKTKDEKPKTVRVPLNERAKKLVEKYDGVDEKGRLFPFISAQKYNEAIKQVLTICEVTRLVTILNPTTGKQEQRPINEIASTHMARRTFIGNLYKQVKDPNLIGSLSGHVEGSKAFVRYREIDDDIKREVVSLIE